MMINIPSSSALSNFYLVNYPQFFGFTSGAAVTSATVAVATPGALTTSGAYGSVTAAWTVGVAPSGVTVVSTNETTMNPSFRCASINLPNSGDSKSGLVYGYIYDGQSSRTIITDLKFMRIS